MVCKPIKSICLFSGPPWAQLELLTVNISVIQLYMRRKLNQISGWAWIIGIILAVQAIMPTLRNLLKVKLSLNFQWVLFLWITYQLWTSYMILIRKKELLFSWNITIPFIWGRTWSTQWQIQFNWKIMLLGLTYALNNFTQIRNIHKALIFPK